MVSVTAAEQSTQPALFINVGLASITAYESHFALLTSKKVIGQAPNVFSGSSVQVSSSQLAIGATIPDVTVLCVAFPSFLFQHSSLFRIIDIELSFGFGFLSFLPFNPAPVPI